MLARTRHALAALTCLAVLSGPALAEEPRPTIVPDDAAWVMRLSLTKLSASPFGKKLIEAMKDREPEKMQGVDHLSDALGIDLLMGLGEGVMFATGFERSDTQIAIDLGTQPGNLEGLLIAAPGYASTEYKGDLLIHSIDSDDAKAVDPKAARLYIAVVPHPTQQRWIALAAHLEPNLKTMIDDLREHERELAKAPMPGDQFMHMAMLRKPEKLGDDDGPQHNILQMINTVQVSADCDDQLELRMTVNVVDAARARQVAQLMQGAIAGVQLHALNNPEAAQLGTLLEDVQVNYTQGETSVSVTAKYSADQVLDLQPDQLDI